MALLWMLPGTIGEDGTPPDISIEFPDDDLTVHDPVVTLRGNASDENLSLVEGRLGEGPWITAEGTGDWNHTVVLEEGANLIQIRASDDGGNQRIASLNLTFHRSGALIDGTVEDGEYADSKAFSGDRYTVHWRVDHNVVTFALKVKTTNWVAIGLDPVKKMKYADMYIGWVDEEGAHLLDSWSLVEEGARHYPDVDQGGTDDLLAFAGAETGGFTTLEWCRYMDTTDEYDNPVPYQGELEIILAYGRSDDPTDMHSGETDGKLELDATEPAGDRDLTPPKIGFVEPVPGSLAVSADLNITGNASDNEGLARVELRLNEGPWQRVEGLASWASNLTLLEGFNLLQARATDTSGNLRTAQAGVIYVEGGGSTGQLDGLISPGEYDFLAVFGSGQFQLHWKVVDDTIQLALVGRTTGWVSIGLEPSAKMKDADMLLAWVANGQASAVDLWSLGATGPHEPDTTLGGTHDILDVGGTESGGITTIELVRKLDTGDGRDRVIPANGTLDLIWAIGPDDGFSLEHTARGYGSIDLLTGEAQEGSSTKWWPYHGVLMALGLVVMNSGIIMALYKKGRKYWLKVHRGLGLAGAGMVLAGWVISLKMVDDHLRVLHGWLGYLAFITALTVPGLGFAMFKVKGKQAKVNARKGHKALGRVLTMLMTMGVLSGLLAAGVL